MSADSAAQAATTVRELDRDRYFTALVLPERVRSGVLALYAFAAEVGTISARVREPMAGEIRLQWWRDALEGRGHGEVRQNPVADALLSTISEYGLPKAPLERLLEARMFDLYHDPMPDVPSFEGYAGETVSTLLQLTAMILNVGRPVEAADAAGHLGVAQALAGHLRGFGFNAARGRIFLPWSVFAANGVAQGEVLAGTDSPGVRAARTQLIALARQHLGKAEVAIAGQPPVIRRAFAAVALLAPQLRRIERSLPPFATPPDLPDWQKLARIALWSLRNR